jgi:hypothetical protein
MSTPSFPSGALVSLPLSVATAAGAAGDPSSLTCRVQDPTGTITLYTLGTDPQITKLATGSYVTTFVALTAGVWYWRYHGVGGVEGATLDGAFITTATRFPNPNT